MPSARLDVENGAMKTRLCLALSLAASVALLTSCNESANAGECRAMLPGFKESTDENLALEGKILALLAAARQPANVAELPNAKRIATDYVLSLAEANGAIRTGLDALDCDRVEPSALRQADALMREREESIKRVRRAMEN